MFKGSGYRLGEEGQESEKVTGAPVSQTRKQVYKLESVVHRSYKLENNPNIC